MTARGSLRLGIIYGGPSAESKVSYSSAKGLEAALKTYYDSIFLLELGPDLGRLLHQWNIDVVFPISHGSPGEDGTLQGYLDILGMPYVGSGVLSSALAMHKASAKRLFQYHGLPIAKDYVVHQSMDIDQSCQHIMEQLGEQVVIKPSAQGSALGVRFADAQSLKATLQAALADQSEVLVEQRLFGREITDGVLQKDDSPDGLLAFPVTEILTPTDHWYDFEHRYTQGLSQHILPAKLSDSCYKKVQSLAKQAFNILYCRDLARVDFVVVGDDPYILEVNTLPGMTPTSLYPEAAEHAGISFPDLAQLLVERAYRRAH